MTPASANGSPPFLPLYIPAVSRSGHSNAAFSYRYLVQRMREIVHIQAGQCGNQIGAKVSFTFVFLLTNINYFNHHPGSYLYPGSSYREMY